MTKKLPQVKKTRNNDWKTRIHSNSKVLVGKPVVKGTRLAVDFILNLFASGWSEKQVLESYPNLTTEDLKAVFAFAADCAKDESLFFIAESGR